MQTNGEVPEGDYQSRAIQPRQVALGNVQGADAGPLSYRTEWVSSNSPSAKLGSGKLMRKFSVTQHQDLARHQSKFHNKNQNGLGRQGVGISILLKSVILFPLLRRNHFPRDLTRIKKRNNILYLLCPLISTNMAPLCPRNGLCTNAGMTRTHADVNAEICCTSFLLPRKWTKPKQTW